MTAPVTDTTLGRPHLQALRKALNRMPGIRLHTYIATAEGEPDIGVLRIPEPASAKHPAGTWEISAPDPTMLRVWWMPNATVGTPDPDGSLVAIGYGSRQHPAPFAAAAIEALDQARTQRDFKVWRPPHGM